MRFHKGSDPWGRGSYEIPDFAVAGASDTGTWDDSPCPSGVAMEELEDFRRWLRADGIASGVEVTESGNVFMVKRWVVVGEPDFAQAQALAAEYLRLRHGSTRLIHDGT